MSEVLLELSRGSIVECIHRGDIAITDCNGNLLFSVGDPDKITFFRSAAKPIQALLLLQTGAYDHFSLTPAELAVVCSSHYAEPCHLEAVSSILTKIGLNDSHVLGGTVTSLNPQYALELAKKQVKLSSLFSDCSGKHSGMLASCVLKGWELDSYLDPNHPCQQSILEILADVCGMNPSEIDIGIDGCSAPVHALPLKNMALGFARVANSQSLPSTLAESAETIFQAMSDHPIMVSGTGGFCTEFIRHNNKRMIGKIGAEGVYCVGVKNKNLGIAVKIENGNMSVLPPIVMEVLRQLNLLDEIVEKQLDNFINMNNKNDLNTVVGRYTPTFTLKKALT